ncbi:MAG: hypothetical protein II619_00765 [Bacilli bacterium]|nr:hypothetical protein [Bacilli bacterium]
MKKSLLFLTVAALTLCSCAEPVEISSSFSPVESSSSAVSLSSKTVSSTLSSSEAASSSQVASSSVLPSSSSLISSSTQPSSSSQMSSSSSYSAGDDTLPNGNLKLSAPENMASPIDVTNWVNFDMSEELPSYWRHIYGNNFTNASFYASSHGGGVKMDQLRKGLQSPILNTWKKLEVRITISSVNNNSQNVNSHKNKPIMLIYGYDSASNLIVQDEIAEGSINANTNEVHFYLRNESLAYFELRLNAFPYKGSQCYNFGIGGVSLKGWPYAS